MSSCFKTMQPKQCIVVEISMRRNRESCDILRVSLCLSLSLSVSLCLSLSLSVSLFLSLFFSLSLSKVPWDENDRQISCGQRDGGGQACRFSSLSLSLSLAPSPSLSLSRQISCGERDDTGEGGRAWRFGRGASDHVSSRFPQLQLREGGGGEGSGGEARGGGGGAWRFGRRRRKHARACGRNLLVSLVLL
jgi:hypothetical protein